MIEWLAMPETGADPATLDAWASAFAEIGLAAKVEHEGPNAAWVEVPSARLRGYALLEGGAVEAINFELREPDPAATLEMLRAVAARIGWELHQEDDDEDDG